MKIRALIFFTLTTTLTACVSSTEKGEIGVERRQLLLVPNSVVLSSSLQQYEATEADAKKKGELDRNPEEVRRVNAVAKRIIPQTGVFRKDAPGWNWEVHVLTSPEINAYCMPGGKINFYSGILEKLQLTDGEIAAVMGHEIAHALREHGRERMTEQLAENVGVMALVLSGKMDQKYAPALMGAAQLAVTLPHSRGQESEADEIGLELMARTGYDPHEALNLWKKMAAQGGSKPPELLSTHPADATRLQNLERLLPKVMPLYHPR